MRGKLTILAIFGVGIAASAFGWWHQWSRGNRVMRLWGSEAARIIRTGQNVELFELAPVGAAYASAEPHVEQPKTGQATDAESPAEPHSDEPSAEPGPAESPDSGEAAELDELTRMGLRPLRRVDLSRAPGLVHLRQALIEDASYDWDAGSDEGMGENESAADLPPSDTPSLSLAWQYALRFSDGRSSVTMVFDVERGRVRAAPSGPEAVIEPIREGLGRYFEEQVGPESVGGE